MNKKIIIGSLLSIFILLLLPSIPAVQYKEINESYKSNLVELIKDQYNQILDKRINNNDNILPTLFAIPYAILTFIILCIIFGIIGTFGTFFAFIINIIIGSITGTLGIIWTIFKLIVNIILTIMNGTITTIGEIFGLISLWFSLIFNAISNKVSSIKGFIVLLIGLVIDILKLIYDTIFPNQIIN
jgi:hypothetical protein